MAFQAVVFDIGGVLEYTPRTGWQDRWAERLGLTRADMEERLHGTFDAGSVGAIDLPEAERQVGERLGLDAGQVDELMGELWTEYLGLLNEELIAYFAALRPRYRTGILSNSFVGAREREAAAYGFPNLCDALLYSHEIGVMKPDPRAYAIACERLAVPPQEAVFVDDLPVCIEGARRAGMTAVRFTDNSQVVAELDALLGRGSSGMDG